MVNARLLAALLAAAPVFPAAAEDEDYGEPPRERVHLTAWGGGLVDTRGRNPGVAFGGLEAAWAFDSLDVGVLGQAYHLGTRARSPWAPVVLARAVQRFELRRGVEATVGIGLGAGLSDHWIGWYQLAVGARLQEGPLYFGVEVGFEQLDLLRLAAGVGVRF
jgi:hypothetical protein